MKGKKKGWKGQGRGTSAQTSKRKGLQSEEEKGDERTPGGFPACEPVLTMRATKRKRTNSTERAPEPTGQET